MSKTCSMCGQEKSVDQFRLYNNGKTWPYCKECESIEVRRRYLEKKGLECSQDEADELVLINRLYEKRLEKGLKTFGQRKRSSGGSCLDLVNKQLKSLD